MKIISIEGEEIMKKVQILGTLILLIITLTACSNKNSKDNVHNDDRNKGGYFILWNEGFN